MIFFIYYYDNDVDENDDDDDDATQWIFIIQMEKTITGNELIECEKLKWKTLLN